MRIRLPSVRDPRSFYDIFSVTTISIIVMAIVLTIWHGSIVRIEMAAFVGLVFLWAGWAIQNTLDRSVDRSTRKPR